ncbi:MAG: nucleotide-binding protein [Chloroflexota bacterium]|nr:nucleotide-binding protein [Chloroflexota bacterium]MDE2941510.1 nucleotide-binding protein [Chloroflexota bacterium]MDE3267729.1 nucleotide-binding protein [Chloroflexota bacterium]
MPKLTREFALARLQEQLDAIPGLMGLTVSSPKFAQWGRDTKVAIAYIFGDSSPQAREFDLIRFVPVATTAFSYLSLEEQYRNGFNEGLGLASGTLSSMINEVRKYWTDDTQAQRPSEVSKTPQPADSRRVFVIHGTDHGSRDTVARFLKDLELEPVILEEQPDRGLTVIEKFEETASGGFVVALLTPDDIGGLSESELKPRARQNVILELGYFVARFGREKVRALVKGNVELPSDFAGVIYIPLDEHGGWRMKLIREMNNAGLAVDANRAL